MLNTLRALVRRVGPRRLARTRRHEAATELADTRASLEPILTAAGFTYVGARSDAGGRGRVVVARYQADAPTFVARFARSAGHLRDDGSPLTLTVTHDLDRRRGRASPIQVRLEDFDLEALLAAVRAGRGAAPRRRRLPDRRRDGPTPRDPTSARVHVADLLRRLFDAAGQR